MAQRSITYRSSFNIVMVVIVAALAVFLTIDAAIRGFWGIALITLLWSLAVTGALALLLVLPKLTADRMGLTCVGPVSTWSIPWVRVDSVQTRRLLLVRTTDGRKITLFSMPHRPSGSRLAQSFDLGDEIEAVRRDWEGHADPDAVTAHRYNLVPLALVGVVWIAAITASLIL